MKVLIVGLGSIASKHIDALRNIDPTVEIFGLRSDKQSATKDGVTNIFAWEDAPDELDFVIISNPTSEHYNTISQAISLKVPLMIEKPALDSVVGSGKLVEKLEQNNVTNYVAFSLRFNPTLLWLKTNLRDKKILELSAYCGSYLPEWRSGQDYTKAYSASKKLGGGVHLDLIHELDYVTWILGMPLKTKGFLSRVSGLKINTFDSAHYWLTYEDKNASITLNYYRRDAKREITIVMNDETWTANLLTNEVIDSTGKIIFASQPSQKSMYYDQMNYLINCINTGRTPMNSLKESLKVLEICLSEDHER